MKRPLRLRPSLLVLVALLVGGAVARWNPSLPVLMLCVLASLGLILRRGWSVAAALVALSVANASLRDVGPRRQLEAWCDGEPLEVAGDLLEPWRFDEEGSSSWLRVRAVGRDGPLEALVVSPDVRIVVRGDLLRGDAGSVATIPDGTRRLMMSARCAPGREWRNIPEVRSGPRLIVPSWQLVEEVGPASGLRPRLARWRGQVVRVFWPGEGVTLSEPPLGQALARALLLGERDLVPVEVSLGMRRFGLAHLLAISGLHVGLIVAMVGVVTVPARPRLRIVAVVVAVASFGFVAGPTPSVLRSVAMVVLGAASLWLARRPRADDALAWALSGVLVVQPAALDTLGFQLTGAATAGVLFLGAPLARRAWTSGRWWRLGAVLAVPIAAQVATLPWALTLFCRVHPAAALLDVVAVAWLSIFLVVGSAWLAIGLVFPAFGLPLAALLEALVAPLQWLLSLPPAPWQSIPVWLPTGAALATTALLAISLRVRRVGIAIAAVAGALVVVGCALPRSPQRAQLTALDVGQGDALLLRDRGVTMLVDGGGWAGPGIGAKVLLPALAGVGVHRLDFVLATHGDQDHCGGLADLALELAIPVALVSPATLQTSCGRTLTQRAGLVRTLEQGDRLKLGRLEITVLGPSGRGVQLAGNDGSLVLRVAGMGRRLLLTGDIERRGELSLVVDHEANDLRSDLLKVGHHGSRSSSTLRFLEAVTPRIALISVGRQNSFGHPSAEVVDRLGSFSPMVFRTDQHGQVRLEWDEGSWHWWSASAAFRELR